MNSRRREKARKRTGSDTCRRQCMVPDIIPYNYPSSDRPRRAGRNCSTAPAIFEMKTIAACPTRYNFARTKAVESRATAIRSEYVRKVKRIDQIFAPNVVGNGNDGISGPFQNAYNTFCWGGVIPSSSERTVRPTKTFKRC